MLECVVNISEGRDEGRIADLAARAGATLLDVHSDEAHHRCVLTLSGDTDGLRTAVHGVSRLAVATLDISPHEGVHPRLGVVDVVPWVDLDDPWAPATAASLAERDRFAAWAAEELGLPCFLYGPERPLPEVRRRAWWDLAPDTGPQEPHPTAGACCVGARGALVAYNLWLSTDDVAAARRVAAAVRRPGLQALGLATGPRAQVSCNLTRPAEIGPDAAYDAVSSAAEADGRSRVLGAELVGLLPRAVLDRIPPERWERLDLSADRTIEHRMAAASR